jgi:hypothetical protein
LYIQLKNKLTEGRHTVTKDVLVPQFRYNYTKDDVVVKLSLQQQVAFENPIHKPIESDAIIIKQPFLAGIKELYKYIYQSGILHEDLVARYDHPLITILI